MKVTFIFPGVGRKPNDRYPSSWVMEPLAIATLSALTPTDVQKVFYDDRFDDIPFDEPTDLVAISVETYAARRAYQIADRFRARGVPVVMGGFHATLAPDEVAQHADAVVLGEAENLWGRIVRDAELRQLQNRYQDEERPDLSNRTLDRSIFNGKRYPVLSLVETGRGCRYRCDFCSIAGFFRQTYVARPIRDVVDEVRQLEKRFVFFVDDNFCADISRTAELLEALIPLKIRWVAQASLHIAKHERLLSLMKRSGCMGLLVGLESINARVLESMNKKVNEASVNFDDALRLLRKHGIGVYGTFVFGYSDDTAEAFQQTYDFALKQRLFFAAFNHVVPFPGTPLYQRLQDEHALLYDKWWLETDYHFGEVAFRPKHFSPEQLASLCFNYRKRFYSWSSILKRAMNFESNCCDWVATVIFFLYNISSGIQIVKRQGLPLGRNDE